MFQRSSQPQKALHGKRFRLVNLQCNAESKQIFALQKVLAGLHLAGLTFNLSFQGVIQSDSIGLLNKNYSE